MTTPDPRKIEFKRYATYKHYTRAMEAAKRYRGWVERKTTKRLGGPRGGRFVRFGRGVAMAPAGLIEYGGVIPPAFEKLYREPRASVRAMGPGLIASGRATIREFKKRPYEMGGEIVGQAALTYGIERGTRFGGRQLTKFSPRYVRPSKIMPQKFQKIPKTGIPATERVPIATSAADIKKMFETGKYTQKGKVVYHAAPTEWKFKPGTKYFEVQAGKSPVEALYTGPEAYTPFAVRAVERTWKPLKQQPKPMFYRIGVEGVDVPSQIPGVKAPRSVLKPISGRLKGAPQPVKAGEMFRSYKAFVESQTRTGKAYISPEAAAPVPWKGVLEVEAVIGKGAKLRPVAKPKFTYTKVPVIRRGKVIGYDVVKIGLQDVELMKQSYLAGVESARSSIPASVSALERARRGAVLQTAPRTPTIITPVPRDFERVQREHQKYVSSIRSDINRIIEGVKRRKPTYTIGERRVPIIPSVIRRPTTMPRRAPETPETPRRPPKTPRRAPERIVRETPKQPPRRVPILPIRPPDKRKEKKRKKKYEEELKKFDEMIIKYDPEAWLEKHPIPTLGEMLGKKK